MGVMKNSAIALALAGVVAAQSSVISVFLPGTDDQTLLGSIITSDASKTTMAIACPTDADADACGFPEPITVTVGPSTFHAEESFESTSVVLDCAVSGTTAAVCAETYVGPAGLIATDISAAASSFDTSVTTTAVTTTLSSTDVAFIPVTIVTTALGDASSNTASLGASASASTASATGTSGTQSTASASGSTGSSSTGTSSASSTGGAVTPSSDSNEGASKGVSRTLAIAAAGAGLLGLIVLL